MAKKKPKTSSNPNSALVLRAIQQEVDQKATDMIENVLKPKHIEPPSPDERFNYIVDITTKWLGSKCFFISTYACPGPNAISPTFETKFARMECVDDGRFTLSFLRQTGEWVALYDALTVDECLKAIQDDPWFEP